METLRHAAAGHDPRANAQRPMEDGCSAIGGAVFMLVDRGDGAFVIVRAAAGDSAEARVFVADGSGELAGWSGLAGAEGEGKRGGAVGVTIGRGMGAVEDVAGVGGGAVDGMEVFADVATNRDEEFAGFEGGGEAGEEFGFEGAGEGA